MNAIKFLTLITLGLLVMAGTSGAKYKVAISEISDAAYNQDVTVDVTIEPDGTVEALGGFDLTISYDPLKLQFVSATQGSFLTDCGWEYFSGQHKDNWVPACCSGCTEVKRIRFLSFADQNNGPYHPSCYAPTGLSQLAQVTFHVLSAQDEVTPINFNWEPNEYPRSCGKNVLVDVLGDDLFVADNIYNNGDYNCSGPNELCATARTFAEVDFYGGSVHLNSPGEFYSDGGSGQIIVRELKVQHEFVLDNFSILVSTGTDFDITDVALEAGVTAVEETCDLDISCWRISADGSISWPATAGGWTTIATITYELDHPCYCNHTYTDDVVFSEYYMLDQYSNPRNVSVNQPEITSGYCGNCPVTSCPVLYTWDGTDFVQDNPLLTACEASEYQDVVVDHYQVQVPVVAIDGSIRFQLREMEDEITYLEAVKLYTIDHPIGTDVVCDVDGYIYIYEEIVEPLSVVDNNGTDQLDAVRVSDGEWFMADEPGYLIVTFPNVFGKRFGYSLSAIDKPLCRKITKVGEGDSQGPGRLTAEILDDNGNWIQVANIPPRENLVYEVVTPAPYLTAEQEVITLRISWTNGYSTDVINQFVPSYEEPIIEGWEMSNYSIRTAGSSEKIWNADDASTPLKMVKGDVLDFRFAVDEVVDPTVRREYVVRAAGRYEPDYAALTNLVPNGYQLHNAYPNPFNPTTTISYDLPRGAQVKLEVYNIMGQRVTTLVNTYQDAGHYDVPWTGEAHNGQAVASGVYFYRLEAGEYVESKRMLLLK
ncbi:MAG: T9SS type A sorting domain-containing protein [bacterium]